MWITEDEDFVAVLVFDDGRLKICKRQYGAKMNNRMKQITKTRWDNPLCYL